jgi:putative DNA primase/helicase
MPSPGSPREGQDRTPIDFGGLAKALLGRAETLVPQWLPGGRGAGREYVCGDLTGGKGRSFSVNLDTGAWADFAGDDRGGDLISLYAAIQGLNNGQAARELMRQLGWSDPDPPRRQRTREQHVDDPRPEPPPDFDGNGARPPGQRRKSVWRAVVPVPPHAPTPTFEHWERRAEDIERTWEYRFEGQLYGHVVRFRTSDGGKEILPHTWCVDESDGRGTHRWHWKQWDEPRPLYVPATLLSADLSLPVVIVEGEKCAQGGHQLLGHEFDFVSWPGGGKAWPKAHWGWLMGRTVFLWPDRDAKRFPLNAHERETGVDPLSKPIKPEPKQPGMAAMVGIGSHLLAEHGCTVLMCRVPKPEAESFHGFPIGDGWDLADAIEQGWTADQVRDFIRAAVPFVAPDDAVRAAGASTPTRAAAGEGDDAAPASNAWIAHLLTSASTGAVKSVRENVVLALDGWPSKGVPGIAECAALIRFNEFTNNVEKTRRTPWGSPAGDWREDDELQMGDWLVREHLMPSMARQALEEAVVIVARRHSYHPLRERMQGLRDRWDRVKRLDTWLQRVCLEEDEWDLREPLHQYLCRAGAWFVMGMVARVLEERRINGKLAVGPGVKFDYMLVLEGPSSWGKSTLASILGGDYFADTGLDVQHKDSLMNIQGIGVYEWSELDQLAKQDIGAIKRFISSPVDRFRATFDRRPAKYPRQVVFVGTTEEATYLQDHKGNRRFWPVRCTRQPDNDWLRDNLEQLLAEAVHRVDALERFWPDAREQRELFNPQQMARAIESPVESAIRRYLYDEHQKTALNEPNGALVSELTMQELLTRIGYTIDKQTDAVAKKAGSVLHMLGWEVKRSSRPGRPRVYVRPADDEALLAGASPGSTPPPGHDNGGGGDDDCPF